MIVLKRKYQKLKNKIYFKSKLSKKKQKEFLMNISVLLEKSYSLNEAIELISQKLDLSIFKNYLLEGMSFSNSLEYLNFDKDILLIISISESTGQLKDGLKRAINILDTKLENINNVSNKMKYPLVLSFFLFLSLSFICSFLLPMFQNVYKSFGIKLSQWQKILFNLLETLPNLIIISSILMIIIILYYYLQSQSDRLKIILRNKFIRKKYYSLYNEIFLFNLHSLLKIGMNLDEIFLILKEQNYNYLLKKESEIIYKRMLMSDDLAEILKDRKIYKNEIIYAIEEGINTGTLSLNVENTLLILENTSKRKLEKYIFLIQPLFYLFFGIIIVFLYACIFVPMFKIMDQL